MTDLEIPRSRLPGWAGGFLDAHGVGRWQTDGGDVLVIGADGVQARLVAPAPGAFAGVTSLRTLVGRPAATTCAVLLVRRGGYAVGVAREGRLLASKCGTRYVQSRTAAGGWSQQRYARRRENQAEELVRAVVGHLLALTVHRDDLDALVVGGDRLLVDRVLSDARLAALAGLPRRELDAVAEPRRAVLEDAARRVDLVRVVVDEPAEQTEQAEPAGDLAAVRAAVRELVDAVPDDARSWVTPCEGWTVGMLTDHLVAHLEDRHGADDGEALLGLVVHGWDLARATGADFAPPAAAVDAAAGWFLPRADPMGDERYSAPVPTRSRSALDQLVALTGRDPGWRPPPPRGSAGQRPAG